ncbi:Txe/YoeB family addiction module toxin [Fulvimarina sp. 2208YS6-2-32]|uniref:Putative mRNA interferase YoeB n=1 Tax=Fulvimarina uroteuthidis TaxID=3098149 RepID=A0ABU5HY24_9HYPH|nr:Txe/YoeB family addiction module toxin [Fulvimarina sp. 2208YS6-2-32]MDY8107673.1 Txe/YoeB family addiction module toxin [Fulvimarina sp. 2208YS6-2-32]
MRIVFTKKAWADYVWWIDHDRNELGRINALIENASRHPSSGIGKPAPLKGELKGFWSRRISKEHRLVYRVEGAGEAQSLVIVACRRHYT